MAGSSTSTWTLNVLLLLPFFISFHQMSAAPLPTPCSVTACEDVDYMEFKINLDGLKPLKEKCSGSYNLNSSLSRLSTEEETCAFPSQFSRGVGNLLSLDLTKCNLQKDDGVVKHLKHLEARLNITNKCPVLVNLYCNDTTLRSAPIASLDSFVEKLTNLLQKYREGCSRSEEPIWSNDSD